MVPEDLLFRARRPGERLAAWLGTEESVQHCVNVASREKRGSRRSNLDGEGALRRALGGIL
jgi:hypothetical protein